MKLSKDHIKRLFEFARQKKVVYRDVQIEIVDHLATAIEQEIQKNKSLSFDEALKLVYAKYPITGFAKMVEEKEKGLQVYWFERFKSYLKSYFKFPRILVWLGLFTLLFFSIMSFSELKNILLVAITAYLFIVLICFFYRSYITEDRQNKYLLIKAYYLAVGWIFGLYYVLGWPMFDMLQATQILVMGTPIWAFVVSLYLSLLLVFGHAVLFVFPEMLKKEFEKQYLNRIELSSQ